MAWQIYLAYGIWLGGNWAYHKLFDEKPPDLEPEALKIPRTEEGTPIPLVYGRCLVKQPIVAWVGNQRALETSGLYIADLAHGAPFFYLADMMLVLGVGFRDGIQGIHRMYAGGVELYQVQPGPPRLDQLIGNGGFEATTPLRGLVGDQTQNAQYMGGNLEFLNGNSSQQLVDGTNTPTTRAAYRMVVGGVPASTIPGYRGFLSVCLFMADFISANPDDSVWIVGTQSPPPAYSFDASSYPAGFSTYPTRIGDDCNPVRVISDLLTGGLGKLEIPTSAIDSDTFTAAGKTLADEGHGYSRSIEERRSASEVIKEILEQIDAVMYEDPRDNKIKLKLIRADYDLNAAPLIHPGNCDAVENYSAFGQTDGVNAVNIQWTDRENNFVTGSARAADNAAITVSGSTPNEINLSYPGCCTRELAENLAARELAARSQPLARCSVIVDRSFRNVMPGDVVRLSWPEYHLNEKVFRVGQVDRGTFTDGRIRLDMVQDFFYVHRRRVHPEGPVTPFPTTRPPLLLG